MSSVVKVYQKPVLHVVVIGFHHKKGCQVEYSYPPLVDGAEVISNEAPPEWKNLPSLAVPDGAHNYVKDTIFFHLPAREGNHKTVYGVACYRQIDAKELKTKADDVTRSTVQKSVCVLSNLPLYGLIQAKLELITHAYFQELDFSQVSLLEETYNNLNASLTESLLNGGSQVYLNMNVKELVITFRHKILMLFKLILLERRVLFTGSPVKKLGNAIMSVLSLFPGMIEQGLVESTAYGVHRQLSPTVRNTSVGDNTEDFLEIRYSEDSRPEVDQYYSNEPESPIIDRGEDGLFPSQAAKSASGQLSKPSSEPKNLTFGSVEKMPVGDCATDFGNAQQEGDFDCVEDYYAKDNGDISSLENQSSGKPKGKNFLQRAVSDIADKTKPSPKQRHSSAPNISKIGVHKNSNDKKTPMALTSVGEVAKNFSDSRIPTLSEQEVEMRKGGSHRLVLSENCDLLQGVTQYEAVQAQTSIPKQGSVIDMDSSPLELKEDYFSSTSPMDGPIPTPDPLAGDLGPICAPHPHLKDSGTHEILTPENDMLNKELKSKERSRKKSDKVEELDSPESISQIDQEDCFSWEDDKLSLAIDTEKADLKLDETAGLTSSFKEISVLDKLHSTEVVAETSGKSTAEGNSTPESPSSNPNSPGIKAAAIKSRLSNAFSGLALKTKRKQSSKEGSEQGSNPGSREPSEPPSPAHSDLAISPMLQQDDFGFPLAIFTKGCVCFPYLSLQYFDLLNDVNIRSFVIGATNMLFRHKRHLTDVVIDVAESKLEIHDRELQKQLALTTADLRFSEILVKAVMGGSEDDYFDGTEWEGNDEWLRAQFRVYLEGLCSAVKSEDPKLTEDYGVSFIQNWKTTHNYKVWSSSEHPGFKDVQAGHPCQGNLSMADIKVRLAHTMQNTEGGKRINAAVTSTGKYVVQTGKAVGGALNQARSSLSSWFSTWRSPPDKDVKDATT